MSISTELLINSLTSSITIQPQQSLPVAFTLYNDNTGSGVYLAGINFITDTEALSIGDFGVFTPNTYQIVSGGVQVTSSVADPSAENSQNITYYPYNISGSSLEEVDYAGNIELGLTSSFNTNLVGNFTTTELFNLVGLGGATYGTVTALATINNSDGTFSGSVSASLSTVQLAASTTAELQITAPVSSVITLGTFARPITNSDFDFNFSSVLIGEDGSKLPIDPANTSYTNFSSSNPAVATVVCSGAFGTTNSAGFEQFVGGGGALSFTGATGSVTITNIISSTLTGSFTIDVVPYQLVSLQIVPSLANTFGTTPAYFKAYGTTDIGTVIDATSLATWTADSPYVLIATGTVEPVSSASVGVVNIAAAFIGSETNAIATAQLVLNLNIT